MRTSRGKAGELKTHFERGSEFTRHGRSEVILNSPVNPSFERNIGDRLLVSPEGNTSEWIGGRSSPSGFTCNISENKQKHNKNLQATFSIHVYITIVCRGQLLLEIIRRIAKAIYYRIWRDVGQEILVSSPFGICYKEK